MKQFYILIIFLITSAAFAQLTPPSELETYYQNVDFSNTGLNLKNGTNATNGLSYTTINKHTNFLSYSQVWDALKITDEDPNNNSNVLLLYGWDNNGSITEHRSRSKNSNGGNVGDWNREHTYPRSLGTPNLGSSGPGSDAHMLRPTDVQRNGQRGNQLFADKSTGQYPNGESGNVTNGWYPGDEWKGDCARIIMYMYLRYGNQCLPSNVSDGSNAGAGDDMMTLLLQWNAEDPVVDGGIEDIRNDYHDSSTNTYAQGNRNPFIDNPYLATVIWGGPAAQNRWENLSTEEFQKNDIKLFPNPIKGNTLTISTQKALQINIYDILGKQVLKSKINTTTNTIDVGQLRKGVYLIKLESDEGVITKKLIKQ